MYSQKSISFSEIARRNQIPDCQIPTLQLLYEITRDDTELLRVLLDLLSPQAKNTISSAIGAVIAGQLTDDILFKRDYVSPNMIYPNLYSHV